jgi:hypothetical protein
VSTKSGPGQITLRDEEIFPSFSDSNTQKLRDEYLSKRVQTRHFNFGCYDAKNESALVRLVDGKYLRIVRIMRAAHAMRWIPNDLRAPVYVYPCNGPCSDVSGVFVDSPIVVTIAFDPKSVTVVPPRIVGHPILFKEPCLGGTAIFQNRQQVEDAFEVVRHHTLIANRFVR